MLTGPIFTREVLTAPRQTNFFLMRAGYVAALFVLAQNYLQDLLKFGATALEGVPLLGAVISPDRWLLWLGVLFVLSVYHFPSGIVGRLRTRVRPGA